MVNYYELLRISPDATVEEIRSAYDEQYRELSQRAMRHHDQAERLKAEQKRLDLENALAVLIDPVKRAEYDAELRGGQGGGLFDPEAPLPDHQPGSMPFMTPPSGQNDIRVDAWVCQECQYPNPIGTRYCQKCRNLVGVNCPKCGKLIEATAKYCPNCSTEVEPALEEKRRKEEEHIRQEQQNRLQILQTQLTELQNQRDELQWLADSQLAPSKGTEGYGTWRQHEEYHKIGCGGAVILLLIFLVVTWISALLISLLAGRNTEAPMLVGMIVGTVVLFFAKPYIQLRFAKPKISADLNNLDSKTEELRKEMKAIQTSSIH